MAIDEQTLDRAQKHNRQAMEALIAEAYPIVFRLSLSLTGRQGAARQVLHDVLRRSLRVIPRWRRGTVPENWFYHHTVISSRAAVAGARAIDPREDVLVQEAQVNGTPADPGYVAYVRAIRTLPTQQSEAFILHHGERLNTRLLGVAMDCSQDAAGKHLDAANAVIESIAGPNAPACLATLQRTYAHLHPPANAIQPAARTYVTRHLRPRRLRRVMWIGFAIALIAACIYGWIERDRLRELINAIPGTSAGPTSTPSR